ncbi:3-isopropylmalate dehydratase large subunit [Acuticoccus sp.]|uniref:3-isopropylmalate dehydratase large subunit n=1 Tax=Acuticoccus sp. TaxID=1904378 RepID=UPI003B51D1D2
MTDAPRTLFEKVWQRHVVAEHPGGEALIYVDRHFTHEGSFHAYRRLGELGLPVRRPDLTFGVADHYVPTRGRDSGIADAAIRGMVERLAENTARHGVRLFGIEDPRQGIVHVMGPEVGLTLPGLVIVCGDSHTATHGAYGAFAFGIGASEVAHVLATQCLWQRRPKVMRITMDGALPTGVSPKDLILSVIGAVGAGGANGHVIEYAGSAVRALSMEGRLTVCNMSIEAGARAGMIAPDETTIAALRGLPFAPTGEAFEQATEAWRALTSDEDAAFDREVQLDARAVEPTVTWGTSPETALPIGAGVPLDADQAALEYMGLERGRPLAGIAVDRAFIGSCTNARIEDLREAAAIVAGHTVRVPLLVSPGSSTVKRQAEAEGLAAIFVAAGAEWVDAGCSMCVGINGDVVPPGERCASSTNRNFPGRQGPGARTHLMSPAMVAAAAVTGAITDVRRLPSAAKVA